MLPIASGNDSWGLNPDFGKGKIIGHKKGNKGARGLQVPEHRTPKDRKEVKHDR